MKSSIRLALMLALGFGATGCLSSREIVTATDHGSESLTLVETVDTYFPFRLPDFGRQVYRFWECRDEGESMICSLACDGDDQAKCPSYGASVGTDVIR